MLFLRAFLFGVVLYKLSLIYASEEIFPTTDLEDLKYSLEQNDDSLIAVISFLKDDLLTEAYDICVQYQNSQCEEKIISIIRSSHVRSIKNLSLQDRLIAKIVKSYSISDIYPFKNHEQILPVLANKDLYISIINFLADKTTKPELLSLLIRADFNNFMTVELFNEFLEKTRKKDYENYIKIKDFLYVNDYLDYDLYEYLNAPISYINWHELIRTASQDEISQKIFEVIKNDDISNFESAYNIFSNSNNWQLIITILNYAEIEEKFNILNYMTSSLSTINPIFENFLDQENNISTASRCEILAKRFTREIINHLAKELPIKSMQAEGFWQNYYNIIYWFIQNPENKVLHIAEKNSLLKYVVSKARILNNNSDVFVDTIWLQETLTAWKEQANGTVPVMRSGFNF